MKLGYEEIKLVSDSSDALSSSKFIAFLKKYAGLKLSPLRGQYDKYCLSG